MTTSCVIFGLSWPNLALQFLCAVGCCFGIAIFHRGLRLRRTAIQTPVSPLSISPGANGDSFPHGVEHAALEPIEEIIRLSPDPVPMKSAEMTQQQKIAAALARAGMSHSSPSWAQGSTKVSVEASQTDLFEQKTTAAHELGSARLTRIPKSGDISQLLIWCGLALALLSCYILVASASHQ